ncbi:MAG: NifB/NifX family molybdenum-iron cluster-binding protein [Bacteroidales bacterium]|nr:NifB/NifX family molybdenum-iron cluster-binding protein [Bacteroidales bacterium]
MKKIALPVENDKLCPHFGHCQSFAVFEVEKGQILNVSKLITPPHEPGKLPQWLSENNVTDVITGGIGQKAISIFNQNGINVFVGAEIKNPNNLVKDFISGNLKSNPNYCDH